MKAPAMTKPVKARSTIQTVSPMMRPLVSAMIAPDAAKAPKARTWPASPTSLGAKKTAGNEAAGP